MIQIHRVELPVAGIDELIAEAQGEGFRFLDQLLPDWFSGAIRFDGPGEGLFGVYQAEELVAVGGLTLDPFAGEKGTGRLRRIYVRRWWRRQGLGELLVRKMLAEASAVFRRVRLQAENDTAARLYERLGFIPIDDEHATHMLALPQGEK